jgi:hypothetical protein
MMKTIANLCAEKTDKSQITIMDVSSHSPNHPKNKISYVKIANPQNTAWAGISLMPLCQVEGDISQIDVSRMKRKLVSNECSTGQIGVAREVRWLQMCLNHALCPNGIPKHKKLTQTQWFSGMSNLILTEMDPTKSSDASVLHMIKHLSRVASLALSLPWSECLKFSAVLFRNLEAANIEWSDWERIEGLHNSALESIRTRSLAISNNAKKAQKDANNPDARNLSRENAEGVPIIWMKDNHVCIRWQSDVCRENTDHTINGGTITLKHVCAVCSYLRKPDDMTHNGRNCPDKKQVFGN